MFVGVCGAPVLSQLVVLGLPEVGQDMVVVPALRPLPLPAVIVLSVAPNVNHGVERGGAPPHSAPGPVHHPSIHVGLGLCVVEPVIPEETPQREKIPEMVFSSLHS